MKLDMELIRKGIKQMPDVQRHEISKMLSYCWSLCDLARDQIRGTGKSIEAIQEAVNLLNEANVAYIGHYDPEIRFHGGKLDGVSFITNDSELVWPVSIKLEYYSGELLTYELIDSWENETGAGSEYAASEQVK